VHACIPLTARRNGNQWDGLIKEELNSAFFAVTTRTTLSELGEEEENKKTTNASAF
jgi:hypothetical protein